MVRNFCVSLAKGAPPQTVNLTLPPVAARTFLNMGSKTLPDIPQSIIFDFRRKLVQKMLRINGFLDETVVSTFLRIFSQTAGTLWCKNGRIGRIRDEDGRFEFLNIPFTVFDGFLCE